MTSTTHVTGQFPATAPEQIDHFARLLAKSDDKRRIFGEVYRGQQKSPKTAAAIGERLNLDAKRVLDLATPLAAAGLFQKTKDQFGYVAYKKYDHVNTVKSKILTLATNKAKLASHVTVRTPRISPTVKTVVVTLSEASVQAEMITIDDVDSFARVREVTADAVPASLDPALLSEAAFKRGIVRIIAGTELSQDWGGEANDIYTTHLVVDGKRVSAAFALKGPAATGTITPAKMGKNGDQLQRLVASGTDVVFVQSERPIAQSIYDQLRDLSTARSALTNKSVHYGVINKTDSYRLRVAYPKQFMEQEEQRDEQ